MASVSSQPQFRYTQPPSKVLHVRNLPWECTEEELIELGKPFGKVVNTKCSVGANRNQAFIELADLNQAIAMISYYASSSEPAQVRGKPVYLQYSNRQEIVNNKTTADVAGNVLLATIEGAEAREVSIDVLNLVSRLLALHLRMKEVHVMETSSIASHCIGRKSTCLKGSYLECKISDSSLGSKLVLNHVEWMIKQTCFAQDNGSWLEYDYVVSNYSLWKYTSSSSCWMEDRQRYSSFHPTLVVNICISWAASLSMSYKICLNIFLMVQVFSTFGFVHKIATFEKTAGFQALVQFSDTETASTAKNVLDGRSIPRVSFDILNLLVTYIPFFPCVSYLLPEHMGPCTLKITFSAHTDLNVKFQSHRSRDYTNPYLPVAPSAIDGSGQFSVGLDGKKQEPESNVILASIENMQYAVTVDVLHMVFSAFGPVQKIAMFEKNGGFHVLIQYPGGANGGNGLADVQTAISAKESLEGHCIYAGGFCKLHISYSRHTDLNIRVNNDRSRDYTIPNPAMLNSQPSILGQQPVSMLGSAAPQYSATQFAPVANGIIGPRPMAGWGPTITAIPQPMPNQLPNHTYMPPGDMPHQMVPGMMQLSSQSSQPPVPTMTPYGH
ncbi:hypothetical protein HHK36_029123 [Tetracentron sinense]|uniref:RRM domain-containing protein n=1 Tax=Tetracentron sinense TaxID=13715 RepID=A0A834YEH6_TETSI|nr:hypothetical protein HHK36_029123 [Tetracentron sinense]